MGLIGSLPPAAKLSAALASVADSTAQAVAGQISYVKTSTNQWSMVMYYQANATVLLGVGLVRPTAASTTWVLQTAATTDVNSFALKGIAAANVSNTGYFSWCYIGGYCPDIQFNSAAASGQLFGLSGSNAGWFGSTASAGSTIAVNTKPFFFPVTSYEVTAANGATTASGVISPVIW